MPAKPKASLYLVCGSEEYLVKEHARKLVQSLTPTGGGEFAVEIVDGMASNADEAVKAVYRTLEAVNTMGFFSSEKIVWLKDASFFGTDKTSMAAAVTDAAADLADRIKKGLPEGVRLVLSAGDMDKRRTLFLTCGKLGEVSVFDAIDTLKDRHWEDKVAGFIAGRAKKLDKAVSDEAASLLIELNGANLRQIEIELEKLATYIGNRHTIEADDVRAVGCASRDAISWDLNDAVGGRNLRKALSTVDRLLFQGEAAIGLLFGLASHLRQLLILRELVDRKVLRPEREFPRVKSQLENIPANVRQEMPADKKLNPLLWNPYRTFKLLPQVALHSRAQLIRAIESLLETNQQMVTGAVPDRLALEELLARVITAK